MRSLYNYEEEIVRKMALKEEAKIVLLLGIVIVLAAWVLVSLALAGLYWFLTVVIFGANIDSFTILWRNTYLVTMGMLILRDVWEFAALHLNRIFSEWDSNTQYLAWMRKNSRRPDDY